ncbi:MAG TPA: hypothetical protein VME18_13070 [Acidobacteriaceae bacterium]|nr:hypothetical protein [Acidobacteriaceae bacterium]
MEIDTISLDLGKTAFPLVGLNRAGEVSFHDRVAVFGSAELDESVVVEPCGDASVG